MQQCMCRHETDMQEGEPHGTGIVGSVEEILVQSFPGQCGGGEFCEVGDGSKQLGLEDGVSDAMEARRIPRKVMEGGEKHMTSVQVKVEKVREEGGQIPGWNGGIIPIMVCRGGATTAAHGEDEGSPTKEGPSMGGHGMQGLCTSSPIGAGEMGLRSNINLHISASIPTSSMQVQCDVKENVPVKISKRTGKPIRKYERKVKKETPILNSGEGGGSFVGQVVAIIDKIAANYEDTLLRGVTGDHIPDDSHGVRGRGAKATEAGEMVRGKQKAGGGPKQGTSAGSGNRGGRGGKALHTESATGAVKLSPVRRVRQRKGGASGVEEVQPPEIFHSPPQKTVVDQGEPSAVERTPAASQPTVQRMEPPVVEVEAQAINSDVNDEMEVQFLPYSPPVTRCGGGQGGHPPAPLRRCLWSIREPNRPGPEGGGHCTQPAMRGTSLNVFSHLAWYRLMLGVRKVCGCPSDYFMSFWSLACCRCCLYSDVSFLRKWAGLGAWAGWGCNG